MYKNTRTLGGRQKIELPLRVRHIGDPKKGSMTAHLQNSAFPANKDTIKIDGLQCLPVLDNPRADVYNKDKERRCPHSGQLPSLSVTLENMTATVWKSGRSFFLSFYFFE